MLPTLFNQREGGLQYKLDAYKQTGEQKAKQIFTYLW